MNCSIRITHSPDYPDHQIGYQSSTADVATCHSRELKGTLTIAAFHTGECLLPSGSALLPNISVDGLFLKIWNKCDLPGSLNKAFGFVGRFW